VSPEIILAAFTKNARMAAIGWIDTCIVSNIYNKLTLFIE
jgi:hypothetical protein